MSLESCWRNFLTKLVLFSTGPTSAADWLYIGSADRKSSSSRECTVCTRDMQMSVQMMTTLNTNCNWWYCVRTANATFPYWKLLFLSSIFKQLLLKNCAVDFVEICNVCTREVIIKAAKRLFNSDKICRSYCDFDFGVTFWNTLYKTHCVITAVATYSSSYVNWGLVADRKNQH